MVKVSVEVSSGAARFSVAVRAESIWRALDLAGQRFPGADVGVRFPIEPEGHGPALPKTRAAPGVGHDEGGEHIEHLSSALGAIDRV